MPENLALGLELLAQVLEIVGAALLIIGFLNATLRYLRRTLTGGGPPAEQNYRQALGRVVLIGLEVLVAATIIKTVSLTPTIEQLGLLASMVAIRTVLGWATVLEMTGRWPWQGKA